jgi:hypothetical protein
MVTFGREVDGGVDEEVGRRDEEERRPAGADDSEAGEMLHFVASTFYNIDNLTVRQHNRSAYICWKSATWNSTTWRSTPKRSTYFSTILRHLQQFDSLLYFRQQNELFFIQTE